LISTTTVVPDVYVANGHETKQSVRDYESSSAPRYLRQLHQKEMLPWPAYFSAKMSRTRGQGWSYGGYENNRFLPEPARPIIRRGRASLAWRSEKIRAPSCRTI